eukprot:3480048-Pleurochrysis_carterae.AAC.1
MKECIAYRLEILRIWHLIALQSSVRSGKQGMWTSLQLVDTGLSLTVLGNTTKSFQAVQVPRSLQENQQLQLANTAQLNSANGTPACPSRAIVIAILTWTT